MKITKNNSYLSRPGLFWALVFVAFLAGFLLRGGCGGPIPSEEPHTLAGESREDTIWTCSMHPQIRLPEPGKCPICFMDLIPVTSAASSGPAAELRLSPAAEALAEIGTTPVRRGRAVKRVHLSGKVVYDETRYRKITAWTKGRIEHLYANETGLAVQAGDPLFELFSPELYSAQEEYLQALSRRKSGSREAAEIMIRAAEERLMQFGMTRKQLADIDGRGTPTATVTIFSPIGGIVIHKNAVEGVYINEGDPVYTVADLSVVWIRLDAYERDLPWMQKGSPVEFTAAALPGKRHTATVTFISPLVDEQTRTAAVRAEAKNRNGVLKPGMFVKADLLAEISNQGEPFLLVPASAVLRTGKRAVVYVREESGGTAVFSGREVVLGVRADTVYTVISGLSEGEEVVVRGNFTIDSAMQIEAKPSMMNPPSRQTGSGGSTAGRQSPSHRPPAAGKFARVVDPVYTYYLQLQKTLVGERFQDAHAAARSLHEAVSEIHADMLAKEDAAVWSNIRETLLTRTEHAHDWADIGAARESFQHISDAVIELEERFGHAGAYELYQAFCPMAFDNRGAFWIQDSAAVSNPYFGSMMLRCGEIRKTYSGTDR